MEFSTFKVLVRSARNNAKDALAHFHGIHDDFRCRAVNVPKYRYIGEYKALSQFGSKGQSYFRIYSSIIGASKYEHKSNLNVGLRSKFDDCVYEAIYSTIMHEYAHVIFEYFKHRDSTMHSYILEHFEEEENFAEEFCRYIEDAYWCEHKQHIDFVLKAWRKVLN